MDPSAFDALTRTLHARRTALTGVLGGVVGLLGLPGITDARRQNKQQHSCTEDTCCNRCGTTQDNRQKTVTCTCPAGKDCLANNGCNLTCTQSELTCVEGCTCGVPLAEKPAIIHCVPSPIFASGIKCGDFLPCETSADCPRGYFCGESSASCLTDICLPNCPV